MKVKSDWEYGVTRTLSSEMLREPGSWQIITRGEGIGPLISISLIVLKVSLEL